MIRVLITAIGGDVGSSIARCLKKDTDDLFIAGCDIQRFNQGLEFADAFYIVPCFDSDMYIEVIKKITIDNRIDIIIPTTESEICIFDSFRGWFNHESVKLMINKHEILDICLSKYKTAKYLEGIGVSVPKTRRGGESLDDLAYPVIVKSEFGNGSQTVRVIYDKNELEDVTPSSEMVVQDYIGSEKDEFTVGVFSDGETTRSISFRRTLETNGGMTVFVEVVNDRKINRIADIVARELKLSGCINLQMRKHNDEYFIFEINPRISGSVGFRSKMGFNDAKWWLELLLGKRVSDYCLQTCATVGVKKYDEVIFEISDESVIVHNEKNRCCDSGSNSINCCEMIDYSSKH